MRALPDRPQFGGGVFIIDCEALMHLPDSWTISGDLEIHGKNAFTDLPKCLNVKGHLKLMGQPQFMVLPNDLRVRGYLIIDDCEGLKGLDALVLKQTTGAKDVFLYDPLLRDE